MRTLYNIGNPLTLPGSILSWYPRQPRHVHSGRHTKRSLFVEGALLNSEGPAICHVNFGGSRVCRRHWLTQDTGRLSLCLEDWSLKRDCSTRLSWTTVGRPFFVPFIKPTVISKILMCPPFVIYPSPVGFRCYLREFFFSPMVADSTTRYSYPTLLVERPKTTRVRGRASHDSVTRQRSYIGIDIERSSKNVYPDKEVCGNGFWRPWSARWKPVLLKAG